MSSPYQIASFRRKISYAGAMLGLFLVTLLVRGLLWVTPESYAWSIQGQADNLEITERTQGQTELTGSAIRLLLTGSRGIAVTLLWSAAIEKQKRDEWNKLELIVDSITQLQPHFITPWLFQSWNLTYNVSVEMDRLNDMYFYISRGISLLARGETLNRRNPDIRYATAFYYQNKFGVSDKVQTLRCLLELSCIPPEERNPARLVNPDRTVNMVEFESFCRKNPQLVRRLREKVNTGTPLEVIEFLRNNEKVPSRYENGKLASRMAQWPLLPDPEQKHEEDLQWNLPFSDARSDGFEVAAAWYNYSLDCTPPPEGKPAETPKPGNKPGDYNPKLYRVPRSPMLVIFRQGYPRARTYIAERLQNEGWFDETPWTVDDGYLTDSTRRWFPNEIVKITPAEYGYASTAWQKAYDLWKRHGQNTGLDLEQSQLLQLGRAAERYGKLKDFTPGRAMAPEPTSSEREDPELMASFDAAQQLIFYDQNVTVTNYRAFRDSCDIESRPTTLKARKLLYEANRRRTLFADRTRAKELYEQAFVEWINIFEQFPRLKDGDLERIAEEVYEANIDYVQILREDNQVQRRRAMLALSDMMRQSSPGFMPNLADLETRSPAMFAGVEPLPVIGILDGTEPKTGKPYISEAVKERVRQRKGLSKPVAAITPPTRATRDTEGPKN